jgi:hypothetical protein
MNPIFSWFSGREVRPEPTPPEPRDTRVRILLPVSGGPNAPAALGILPGLASPDHRITVLNVRRPGKPRLEGLAEGFSGLPDLRVSEVVANDVGRTIVDATADADLLVLGASEGGPPLAGFTLDLVRRSACASIVVRRRRDARRLGRDGPRALVVAQSWPGARVALDDAIRWARAGSVSQHLLIGGAEEDESLDLELTPARTGFGRIRSSHHEPRPLDALEVVEEVQRGRHDLVVVAADADRMEDEQAWIDVLAEVAPCAVVVVFARRAGPPTRRRRALAGSV